MECIFIAAVQWTGYKYCRKMWLTKILTNLTISTSDCFFYSKTSMYTGYI